MADDNDQIIIDTKLKYMFYGGHLYITAASLAVLLAELYEKGVNIGWETKILDLMNDKVRDLVNAHG